ncbi:MAG: SRPBCC domain-containing protein [Bacteroidota bacterium]
MPNLTASISIAASPDTVWLALVDFPRWVNWNPFLRDLEGVALAGERVRVTIDPNYEALFAEMAGTPDLSRFENTLVLKKRSTYRPRIINYDPGRLLTWETRNLFLGSYQHRFALRLGLDERTHFEQRVSMSGLLVGVGWETAIEPLYRGGMKLMNLGLKHWVESGAGNLAIDFEA